MTLDFETLKASIILYGLNAVYAIALLLVGWWLSGGRSASSPATW
jgi:small conductance mechanosensitive channel